MTEEMAVVNAPGLPSSETGLHINNVLAHYQYVQQVMNDIMREGTHYGGSFPGDTKKNLLKPGADALGVAFRFCTDFEVEERSFENYHREYRVTCHIKTATGILVSQGLGTCSTLESKYRWRGGARLCPECGKAAIIKGKPEYAPKGEDGTRRRDYEKGGWLCFKKKDGCGATFADEAPEIVGQTTERVENTDPADQWNTCLKIGKKRAYVDAMITATGASNLFTQDAEEFDRPDTPAKADAPATQAASAPKAQAPVASPSAARPGDKPDPVKFGAMLHACKSKMELEDTWAKTILPVQGQLPAATVANLAKIKREVDAFLTSGSK